MLKRVLSIAVTAVMMLTLVCFAAAEGAVSLEIAASESSVVMGEDVVVTVQLNNYTTPWCQLAIELDYDAEALELSSVDTSGFCAAGSYSELGAGVLKAEWAAEENVAQEECFDALKVTFVAKAEAQNAPISARILGAKSLSEENVAADVDAAEYSAESAFLADGITIASAQPAPSEEPEAESEEPEVESEEPIAPEEIIIESKEPVLLENAGAALPSLSASAASAKVLKGEKVLYNVVIKDYQPWMAMSVQVKYDPAKLSVAEESDVKVSLFGDSNAAADVSRMESGENGGYPLIVTWLNPDGNFEATGDAAILSIYFTALQTGEHDVEFSFREGGQVRMDDGGAFAKLSGEIDYAGDPASASVVVVDAPAELVMSEPILTGDDGDGIAEVGEKLTYTIRLKNYYVPWTTLAVFFKYDTDVLSAESESAVVGEDSENVVVVTELDEATEGATPMKIAFISLMGDNIPASGEAELALATVTLTIKQSVTNGTVESYIHPESVYRVDEKGATEPLTAEGGYFTEAKQQDQFTVLGRPPYLTLEADKSEIKQGEEVTFTVTLNDFDTPWMAMTLLGNYNPDVFEFVGAEDLKNYGNGDTSFIVEQTKSKTSPLAICWLSFEDLGMEAPTMPILKVTLRAKQEVTEDSYPVSFTFAPDGNVSTIYSVATPLPADGNYFVLEAEKEEILVTPDETLVSISIEWSAMQFTYDSGTWNTGTHQWEGAGWEYAEESNKIIVTNNGAASVLAAFEFGAAEGYEGLSGSFTHDGAALEAPLRIPADKMPKNIYFALSGKTTETWEDQFRTVGLITITIAADEEVSA